MELTLHQGYRFSLLRNVTVPSRVSTVNKSLCSLLSSESEIDTPGPFKTNPATSGLLIQTQAPILSGQFYHDIQCWALPALAVLSDAAATTPPNEDVHLFEHDYPNDALSDDAFFNLLIHRRSWIPLRMKACNLACNDGTALITKSHKVELSLRCHEQRTATVNFTHASINVTFIISRYAESLLNDTFE